MRLLPGRISLLLGVPVRLQNLPGVHERKFLGDVV
jgi:hypothetical protein